MQSHGRGSRPHGCSLQPSLVVRDWTGEVGSYGFEEPFTPSCERRNDNSRFLLSLRSLRLSLLALHDHSDEQKTLKASHPRFEGFAVCGVLSQIQKHLSKGLGFPGTLMSSWEGNSQTFGILGNVRSIKYQVVPSCPVAKQETFQGSNR